MRPAAVLTAGPVGGMRRRRRLGLFRLRGRSGSSVRRYGLLVVVANVVIVERAVRIVALNRAPVGRVVFGRRQGQPRAERELKDLLDQCLAETGLADDEAAPVIL